MAIAFLSALILAVQPAPAPAHPPLRSLRPVTVVNSVDIPRFDTLGSCRTRDGREIDLHRVLFLDDRPVVFDAPGGPFRAYVQGQRLLIDALNPDGEVRDTYFNRIDYQVSEDGDGGLDLQIQLAWAEGRLAVYWRETYRNRVYHQGLYAIAGQSVAVLCTGMGGIQTED